MKSVWLKTLLVGWAVGLGGLTPLAWAQRLPLEEAAPRASAQEASLAQLIEEYEKTEKELLRLREQQKQTRAASETQRLHAQIQLLEAQQAKRAEALEKIVPQPPAVLPEKTVPLERVIRLQEKRQDAVLEKNLDRR